MLSDAFGTLIVRAIGIVLIFVSTTLTARLLGPTEFGTYSAALALALLLATLAPMGTDRILVRNLSTVRNHEEAGHETAIAHICTAIVAMLLLCGCLSAWLVNALILDNQKWAQTALLASILFLPLTVTYLRQWVAIPLIGTRRAVLPEQTILPLVFTSLIFVVFAAGLPFSSLSTAILYAAIMLVVWVGSLATKPLRSAYLSALRARPRPESSVRQRIIDGIPFVSVAIGGVLSQTCMPLVIAATCGFDETAHFALAMPYAALPAIPLGIFNLSMIPRCARHFQNGEFAEANHAVRSAATATFVLSALISLCTLTLSPWLVLLLGESYAPVCRLFPALLLAAIVDCLTGPTIPVMQTMRMEKSYSRALFAYFPIQVGLIYLFGKHAGIEGAALAYLIARCLWNVIVLIQIYQVRGLVMLPYLHMSRAIHEWSAGLSGDHRRTTARHQSWIPVSIPEPKSEVLRAA